MTTIHNIDTIYEKDHETDDKVFFNFTQSEQKNVAGYFFIYNDISIPNTIFYNNLNGVSSLYSFKYNKTPYNNNLYRILIIRHSTNRSIDKNQILQKYDNLIKNIKVHNQKKATTSKLDNLDFTKIDFTNTQGKHFEVKYSPFFILDNIVDLKVKNENNSTMIDKINKLIKTTTSDVTTKKRNYKLRVEFKDLKPFDTFNNKVFEKFDFEKNNTDVDYVLKTQFSNSYYRNYKDKINGIYHVRKCNISSDSIEDITNVLKKILFFSTSNIEIYANTKRILDRNDIDNLDITITTNIK